MMEKVSLRNLSESLAIWWKKAEESALKMALEWCTETF